MVLLRSLATAALCAPLLAAVPLRSQAQAPARQPAPERAPVTLQATRLQGEVRLDGRLDEAAWQAVPAVTEFSQSYPDAGAAATVRTEARVAYGIAARDAGELTRGLTLARACGADTLAARAREVLREGRGWG